MEIDEQLGSALNAILDRYRDSGGNVDYLALMADGAISQYSESLAEFDLASLGSRDEELAFWINCYNSLSIYGVIRKLKTDPTFAEKGNTSWLQRVRFFAFQKFNVGEKEYTLRQIENKIREDFKDPRIHFALNCSSMGCPILKDGLYSAANIDAELTAATELYLSSPHGLRIDKDKSLLYLSMIFKWYRKDFEATGKSIVDYVAQFVPDEMRAYIADNIDTIKVKYIQYEWALNQSFEKE